jgi:hypothetical protein
MNTKYANSKLNKTVTWNDLVNTHYWSVGLVAATVGDNSIPIVSNVAIVDTGTSYLLMP